MALEDNINDDEQAAYVNEPVGNENTGNNNHLVALSGSDYEIADGEPYIKGWDVKNELGQLIGEVDDLLFDPESRKVRYIIVDLDGNELGLDTDKKVLVPIGVADIYNSDDLDEDDDDDDDTLTASDRGPVDETNAEYRPAAERNKKSEYTEDLDQVYDADEASYNPAYDSDVVIIPATLVQLQALPAYDPDHLSAETESGIRSIFDEQAAVLTYNRDEFYNHEHFSEGGYFDRGATMTQNLPGEHQDPDFEDESPLKPE